MFGTTWLSTARAFAPSYLDSLSVVTMDDTREASVAFLEENEAPDEFYGKHNPMASWSGWKHPQWGGYLDHLSCTPTMQSEEQGQEAVFGQGKASDYGDDVRWGAQVYLDGIGG